jgi:hypothetical protein
VLAEAGLWDRAEHAARAITDHTDQAPAFVVIAASLIAASAEERAPMGELLRGRAHKLLAHVLAGSQWRDAVRPLGKLDPWAIVAISEALHSLTPQSGHGSTSPL